MTDLLEKSSQWLEQMRTQHASHAVTYVRGVLSVQPSATVGKTVFEVDDGYGVMLRHELRDFLILAADLVLDDQVVLPERGDRIKETQGTVVYIYEVTAPGKEPVWRYSDPYRNTLRIHTKKIDTEASP
jgi:hypothetical protein